MLKEIRKYNKITAKDTAELLAIGLVALMSIGSIITGNLKSIVAASEISEKTQLFLSAFLLIILFGASWRVGSAVSDFRSESLNLFIEIPRLIAILCMYAAFEIAFS